MAKYELQWRVIKTQDTDKTLDRAGYTVRQALEADLYPVQELNSFSRDQSTATKVAGYLSRIIYTLLKRQAISPEDLDEILGNGWEWVMTQGADNLSSNSVRGENHDTDDQGR